MELEEIGNAQEKELSAYVLLLCREYLSENPAHGPTWCRKGIALIELRRYSESEEALNKALKLCPEEKKHIVLSQFGHLEEARGNLDEARSWFQKSHKANPRDASYLILIGSTYMKQGNLEKAEKYQRLAITLTEGCIEEAYFNLGGVLLAKEQYIEARKCYLKALDIDPDYGLAKKWLNDLEATIAHARQRKGQVV